MSGEPKTYEEALETLNERQRGFVVAYAGNASEAALNAGYPHGASGARLLKNVKVKRALTLRDKRDQKLEVVAGVPTDLPVPEPARRALDANLDQAEFLELTRLNREQLELFLCGVVAGTVEEHGVGLTGPWSGPPKIRDRLKAAEMLARMNHWNASDGGGEKDDMADPYNHKKLTREELKERAQETAKKLVLLQGGGG